MNLKRGISFFAWTCMLMILIPARTGSAGTPKVIHAVCPTSMFDRVHAVTEVFMKEHPLIQVDLREDLNVNGTLRALIEESVEIGLATRRVSVEEDRLAGSRGVELAEHLIGYGGIVVITSPRNPLDELTVEQVRKIFTGEITSWKDVGGSEGRITVVRVGDTTHPGTVFFMQEDFFGGKPFAADAVVEPEFAGILRKTLQIPGSVGFVRIRDAFELAVPYGMPIKILNIKADQDAPPIRPSRATIDNGSYPLRRPYYVYCKRSADSNVMKYIEFLRKMGWGPQDLAIQTPH